jgi:hypothetical protein
MGSDVICRNFERKKPVVSGSGCVVAIFISSPDKRVFNCGVETEMSGVDKIFNFRWKLSVKFMSMNAITGENIFYRKLEIMDVDNGNMTANGTMSTPMAEPERRRT